MLARPPIAILADKGDELNVDFFECLVGMSIGSLLVKRRIEQVLKKARPLCMIES